MNSAEALPLISIDILFVLMVAIVCEQDNSVRCIWVIDVGNAFGWQAGNSTNSGNDVEIEFKRTIELASRLQGILSEARVKMFKELSKLGITKNDLIVRKDDGNGHITYDETNYQEFQLHYL